jgi:hypothetical protein
MLDHDGRSVGLKVAADHGQRLKVRCSYHRHADFQSPSGHFYALESAI